MQNIIDFINDNKQYYQTALDNQSFSLLFSDEPLLPKQVDLLTRQSTCIVLPCNSHLKGDTYYILSDRITTFIISSIQTNCGCIQLIAAANYIYIDSNTTHKLHGKISISIVTDAKDIDNDFVVLSEDNIVKHIGIVKDDTIDWNYTIYNVPGNVYLHCNPPSYDLNKKAISYLILDKMR